MMMEEGRRNSRRPCSSTIEGQRGEEETKVHIALYHIIAHEFKHLL
jgi:hypothetical protein